GWSVQLARGLGTSNGSLIQFLEPNGSYAFNVRPLAGFRASPSAGVVTVNGSSVTIRIAWSRVTYPVSFQESGLPSGTPWNVTVVGGGSAEGSSSLLTVAVPNGTFNFTFVPLRQGYVGGNGVVTVNGTGLQRTVAFVRVEYSVTFRSLNLTPGVRWSVTLGSEL
ncbi:thermopsin precursor, partial [mine drainage metagenome]